MLAGIKGREQTSTIFVLKDVARRCHNQSATDPPGEKAFYNYQVNCMKTFFCIIITLLQPHRQHPPLNTQKPFLGYPKFTCACKELCDMYKINLVEQHQLTRVYPSPSQLHPTLRNLLTTSFRKKNNQRQLSQAPWYKQIY